MSTRGCCRPAPPGPSVPCVVRWTWTGHAPGTLYDLANDEERGRAGSLRIPLDRERSMLGAGLLRATVSELSGTPAKQVLVVHRCRFCGGPHGRPELPGSGLHGSISHAGQRVCVAVTGAGPVGVDIEPLAPVHPGLLAEMTGPAERTGAAGDRDVLVLWTRKEAVLKATGEGLSTALTAVVVTPAARPAALLSHEALPHLKCRLVDLRLQPGYAGAVAILTTADVHVQERCVTP